mmetsp:Transcript_25878/g.61371  ORF Transcript_25878/g.61371 Transcript_25878/m.61371 type:complete len:1308 (+) Transcript_25878:76-3999(+)
MTTAMMIKESHDDEGIDGISSDSAGEGEEGEHSNINSPTASDIEGRDGGDNNNNNNNDNDNDDNHNGSDTDLGYVDDEFFHDTNANDDVVDDDRSATSSNNSVSNHSTNSRGAGGGGSAGGGGRLVRGLLKKNDKKQKRKPLRNPFSNRQRQQQRDKGRGAGVLASHQEEDHTSVGFDGDDTAAEDLDFSSSHNNHVSSNVNDESEYGYDNDAGEFDDSFDLGIFNRSPISPSKRSPKSPKNKHKIQFDPRKVAENVTAKVNKTMTQIQNHHQQNKKDESSSTVFNSTKLSVSEIEKLAQKRGANTEIERFAVFPSYAYPKTKFNREELRQEMNKPSYYYHDLRPAPLMSKNPESYKLRPLIGYVNMEILQCFGIPKIGVRTETSAFCVIVCQDKAFKTDTMPHVANPMWLSKMRRACVFPLYEAYARVYLGVFGRVEASNSRDLFIGRVVLDVTRLRPGSTYDVTLPLRQSNQVYARQKCGSIRFRIHLTWLDERAALLSYLPKNPTSPNFEPHDTVTIKCLDNKSFQNVVRTVHGHDLPGKFSMKLTKATMREFNFVRVHILRYLRKRELRNITQWRYPFISFFLFASWMHSAYVGSMKYVPGNFVTYLVLVLFKNYCLYVIDGKHDNGFSMPTIEELMSSLLYGRPGSNHIEPLEMERMDPDSCKTVTEYFDEDDQNNNNNNSSILSMSSSQQIRKPSLQDIAIEFRNGVKRTGRRRRNANGVTINTFTGIDAVDFLTGCVFASDRVEAVELGRRLQHELHLFEHIRRRQEFKDENIFYAFLNYDTSEYVFKTHQPWFKNFAKMIGFHRDEMSPAEAHMEFPFASGNDHPRFTIKDSLVVRSKESRNALARKESADEDEESGDDGDAMNDRGGTTDRIDDDDGRDDSGPSIVFDMGSLYPDQNGLDNALLHPAKSDDDSEFDGNEVVEINEQDDIETKHLPKPPNQDMLFVKKADKPIPEALSNTTSQVHRMFGHLFNDKAYKLPLEPDSVSPPPPPPPEGGAEDSRGGSGSPRSKNRKFFSSKRSGSGPRKKDAALVKVRKDEYDKLLHSAKYSTNNVIASRVAVIVQPIVELVQLFLSITRAQFNILTWRDPFLTFWVATFLVVLVPILHMFPWRLVFGVAGLVLVGPQNWLFRIIREQQNGGPEPDEFDVIKKRKKSASSNSDEDEEPFFFSSFTPNNRPILDDELDKRPESIKEVAIPHSQFMYRRCYDWPPEPEYARILKSDAPRSDPDAQMILEGGSVEIFGNDGTGDGSRSPTPNRRRAYSNQSNGHSGGNNQNHGKLNQRARQMVSKLRRQKSKES